MVVTILRNLYGNTYEVHYVGCQCSDKLQNNMEVTINKTFKWFSPQKIICDKVFQSGPSKICGRQPLKDLKGYGLLKQTFQPQSLATELLIK